MCAGQLGAYCASTWALTMTESISSATTFCLAFEEAEALLALLDAEADAEDA